MKREKLISAAQLLALIIATKSAPAHAEKTEAQRFVVVVGDVNHPCQAAEVQDLKKAVKEAGLKVEDFAFQLVVSGSCQDSSQVMDPYQMNNGTNIKVDESLKLKTFSTMDLCKKTLEQAIKAAAAKLVDECKALCDKNRMKWTVDPKVADMYAHRGGWSGGVTTGVYVNVGLSKEQMGACKL